MQIRRACDLLELEFCRTAADFSATDEYDNCGANSPVDWIRHNCQMSSSAAADRLTVGQQLGKLGRSVEAMASGQIGYAHLTLIAHTAEWFQEIFGHGGLHRLGKAARFDEAKLIERAHQYSVGRLWHFCRRLRHAANPTRVVAEEKEAAEARFLEIKPREDGSVWIDGWLDPVGGATLRTALEPLTRPAGDGDDRSRARRYADALVELANHVLDSGTLPSHASQRPHLQVTTTLETLNGIAGSPAADMEMAAPVSSAVVERLACDATVSRVLLSPQSLVIDVGRGRRVVSGALRRALNARDGTCRWPGCERPASWSAAHHLVHWVHGGSTDLDNLVLLCHRHHWMTHEAGWQLIKEGSGVLRAIPPPMDTMSAFCA